jgi:hypothetical protein
MTVPLPVPALSTVKLNPVKLNVAVQVMLPLTATVLAHPTPDHPANVEPVAAVALSATELPLVKLSLQSVPQLIPLAVTVPLPVPSLTIVRIKDVGAFKLNVAVQVMLPLTVTVLAQPVPDHPANVEPLAAVALSATELPLVKLSLQSVPQLIPFAVTVPLPVPVFATVRVKLLRLNVAVQVMLPLTVTVLAQPVPDHPANVEPLAAVALSDTELPLVKLSLQSVPQLIPFAVTVPLPVPVLATVSVKELGPLRLKVAVQVMSLLTVIVPAQPAPDHPANVEPLAAVALSDTELPLVKLSLQSVPQLIPLAVTVPLPVPVLATVSK